MTDPAVRAYEARESSWIRGLEPPDALALPAKRVIEILLARFGDKIDAVLLGPTAAGGRGPQAVPVLPRGRNWIRRTRMVGINVRTVGSFWRVIHYALTLPALYDSIHLLPVWEPGVVGSLYGIASWDLAPEFLDTELAELVPALATPEAQLEAVIRILHLAGRAVGMDMIPHTDRFSEIVIGEPDKFEWLRRDGAKIVDHRANLHEEVMQEIDAFLASDGPAGGANAPANHASVFDPSVTEDVRREVLFGRAEERELRSARRQAIITRIKLRGFEPVPATMAPPYRGIEVDPRTLHTDKLGRSWCEYRIRRPEPMSRVFGPLARYKFYERKDDNAAWEIDFSRPRKAVFDYLARRVGAIQERFGFDFIRGDMSHVQMRPEGVPAQTNEFYDPFRYVCREIRRRVPGFPYFAESFLAPPGTMAYGDEVTHLEASGASVTLGDLQSVPVGGPEFLPRLRRYLDIASTRSVTPAFTVMTGDKDDPRFDSFYESGNELRAFLSFLLPALPSYTALGFELRDLHEEPAPNEYYTKLYVFHESEGPKATRGPYRFGSNHELFSELTRIREFAESVFGRYGKPDDGRSDDALAGDALTGLAIARNGLRARWLLPPDATAGSRVIAWELVANAAGLLVCVANTDTSTARHNVYVPLGPERREIGATDTSNARHDTALHHDDAPTDEGPPRVAFATPATASEGVALAQAGTSGIQIAFLPPGGCAVFEIPNAGRGNAA